MTDFHSANDMIRDALDKDKLSEQSLTLSLVDRLEELTVELVKKTIDMDRRQFYVSFPISLDGFNPSAQHTSPVNASERRISEGDWTDHLAKVFDIEMTSTYGVLTFQDIVKNIDDIFNDLNVSFTSRFGRLTDEPGFRSTFYIGNYWYWSDSGGYGWESKVLTCPNFFEKKNDEVPVYIVDETFCYVNGGMAVVDSELIEAPTTTTSPEDFYLNKKNPRISFFEDEDHIRKQKVGCLTRINYFVQFV